MPSVCSAPHPVPSLPGYLADQAPRFHPGKVALDGGAAYFADTFSRRLLRFALNASGNPMSHSVFATIPPEDGYPDGMTTDEAGTLYIGHWDGARISRWTRDGTALSAIPVPARNVTSLAFGGDGMRTVAITTAALASGQTNDPVLDWHSDLLSIRSPVAGLVEPMLATDWAG